MQASRADADTMEHDKTSASATSQESRNTYTTGRIPDQPVLVYGGLWGVVGVVVGLWGVVVGYSGVVGSVRFHMLVWAELM